MAIIHNLAPRAQRKMCVCARVGGIDTEDYRLLSLFVHFMHWPEGYHGRSV